MARASKLKVFRTAIGFHDAYVAAPSQKAALDAWGAKADLFARGVAERVDDPELSREPLAKPGEVIRRSRGTTAEQLAALPPDQPKRDDRSAPAAPTPDKRSPRPKPRPSREPLDAAEQAIDDENQRHEARLADFAAREADLRAARRDEDKAFNDARESLERDRDRERVRYDRAMERWRR